MPSLTDLFIVPFASMLAFSLDIVGFPKLFIIATLAATAFLWHYREQLTMASVMHSILKMVVRLFFREIDYRGLHKIPKEGPVLFVCAPHANQFLDPLVVIEVTGRRPGFLCAAKTIRRADVGWIAKCLGAIPVERPQDLAKKGTGKITVAGKTVTGHGTKFTEEFPETGLGIAFGDREGDPVAQVVSDTELLLKAPLEKDITEPQSFKVLPRVDQSQVFEHVWEALGQGRAIGIFPEGGSHDRTELLPLKAGVTIMALGAHTKFKSLDVCIVPVGLNYFHGHRFRSRVYVDVGDPIYLSKYPTLVSKYEAGSEQKRAACGELLDIIHKSLLSVTVNAPTYRQLELMWAIRRLYKPSNLRLTADQKLELTRRFEVSYEKLKDLPKIQALTARVQDYNQQLKIHGLRDHQVKTTAIGGPRALFRLVWRVVMLSVYACFALPGLLLNAPIIILARAVSHRKAKEAVAASTVKIAGRDVLATWKALVALALLPLTLVVYPSLAALLGWWFGWGALNTWAYFALLQPFVMYSSVRATEIGAEIARSLTPLLWSLVKKQSGTELRQIRDQLKLEIRALVAELGPQFFDKFIVAPAMTRQQTSVVNPEELKRFQELYREEIRRQSQDKKETSSSAPAAADPATTTTTTAAAPVEDVREEEEEDDDDDETPSAPFTSGLPTPLSPSPDTPSGGVTDPFSPAAPDTLPRSAVDDDDD